MHALAVTEQGAHVHVEGESLILAKEGEELRRVRLQEVDEVLLFGRVEITSAAVAALVRRGVDVVLLTGQGYFRARVAGRGSRNVALRLAQFRRAEDPAFCLRVARAMVVGKITSQRALLLRAQRKLKDEGVAEALGKMRLMIDRAAREADLDVLRGLEGQGAALYFGEFGKMVRTAAPGLEFHGRNRRPPRDPVNACLSFGYSLLGNVAETEVLRSGLDPMLGFFHQPDRGRPSLMLDLLEEFRPYVDGLVLRLINRGQLGAPDFERRSGQSLEQILAESGDGAGAGSAPGAEAAGGSGAPEVEGVYLNEHGRRIFLAEFFRRLRETVYYPPREAALELRAIVREQAYRLARVIEGREDEYAAFVAT